MPKIFGSHMVLQRGANVRLWGKSAPNAALWVDFVGTRTYIVADTAGTWLVYLPKFEAGGPYTLRVFLQNDSTQELRFDDVMLGDVWLASGQSNMEWQVQQALGAETEIPQAANKNLRFFVVPHQKSIEPEADLSGGAWAVADSISVRTVSAVAYYFAKEIEANVQVAVGILQSTWGGTPVEAWTSSEMLGSLAFMKPRLGELEGISLQSFVQDSLDLIRFWDIVYHAPKGFDTQLTRSNFVDDDWPELRMPSTHKDWSFAPFEGMIWMRKSFDLKANSLGCDFEIFLGKPEMNYSVFFNGVEICNTVWNARLMHNYKIPKELLRSGKNTVTIRMAALWGGGGFGSLPEDMFLTNGLVKIALAGMWKYNIGLEPQIPAIMNYQYYPSLVYNAMIHPLEPYNVRGFLWYQGEANDTASVHYQSLFPCLINDWRIRWQQRMLPFIFVQLPNYMSAHELPTESNWAAMREAQAMALALPSTAMVCTIDLGDALTIHPLRKTEVGLRLAWAALRGVYGKNVLASGPSFVGFSIQDNLARVKFNCAASGLRTTDSAELTGFSVAGADGKFYWAKAHIEGDTVVLCADEVSAPVSVRYNWADNPSGKLSDSSGLPALPFRTDK
jgi:sialate O-acetylesterase